MNEWLLLLAGILIWNAGLLWQLHSRRRRRQDMAFAARIRDEMLRGNRRRPRVDNRIQRRRFGQ